MACSAKSAQGPNNIGDLLRALAHAHDVPMPSQEIPIKATT